MVTNLRGCTGAIIYSQIPHAANESVHPNLEAEDPWCHFSKLIKFQIKTRSICTRMDPLGDKEQLFFVPSELILQ